jgi:hypothetical protein
MPLSVPSGAPTLFIRRSAYERSGLDRTSIDARLSLTPEEFRVEGTLIAIGPLAGEDTLTDIIGELEASGLAYFDDFFELSGNWPEWLRLFCAAEDSTTARRS